MQDYIPSDTRFPSSRESDYSAFGLLSITGKDAASFLQGQLTVDIMQIQTEPLVAAALNPKGRALALGWLCAYEQGFLWVLPAELVLPTLSHLKRFIIRSQVSLSDVSASWQVVLNTQAVNTDGISCLPASLRTKTTWSAQLLQATPLSSSNMTAWHRACLLVAYPTLNLAHRERFTAHELNLQTFEGVSFTKGCYTGQEIVARMHYRGKPKTALQAVYISGFKPEQLGTQDSLMLTENKQVIELVDGQWQADGRLLALALLPQGLRSRLPITLQEQTLGSLEVL